MKPLAGSAGESLKLHRRSAATGVRTTLIGVFLIATLSWVQAAPDPVVVQGTTGTAQGNQTNGILSGRDFSSPPVQTLNVNALVDAIRPSSGSTGIGFTNTTGGNVIINAGDTTTNVVITTSGNQAVGIGAESRGTPGAAPVDPFLGVPIPGSPEVAGGVVQIDSRADITTAGTHAHGILAQSRTTGYGSDVITALENFSETPFSFVVTSVTNANGSTGTVGQAVQGVLIGTNGSPTAGQGGTFTLNSNGTFAFDPGTNFNDLAVGQIRVSSVTYALSGLSNGVVRRTGISGQLFVTVTNTGSGLQVIGSESYFPDYGESTKPQTANVAFPDLRQYVQSLIGTANDAGGGGNSVAVTNQSGAITTTGSASHGIFAESAGKAGAGGQHGGGFFSFGTRPPSIGADGNAGGNVSVAVNGSITTEFKGTANDASLGVFAFSRGGDGGRGGNGGTYYDGRRGGIGGAGGTVEVYGSGTIHTLGDFSSGIFAASEGGNGGDGGDGGVFTDGQHGGYGGQGGSVILDGLWNITTEGDKAHGIWAKSIGGNAGTGGSGGWLFGSPAGGGQATDGGSVRVTSGGIIETLGDDAFGIYAQSVGGFGGSGGSGGSIFYSAGGNGNSAGSGGFVSVVQTETGSILTHGTSAHALFAQSVGGGGGSGGGAGAIVAEGGAGAPGGNGRGVDVANFGSIVTLGTNAHGIYAQSVGGGGGDGGSAVGAGAIGGRGSGTSDGGRVTVTNTGAITTTRERANAIFAESIGGGGGDGGASKGWFSVGGKAGGGGNASNVVVVTSGELLTQGADSSAVFAQSVGGGGGNGGASIAAGAYISLAIGGDGGAGGNGNAVLVVSEGNGIATNIVTEGTRSHGIFAQSVGGGGGNGGYAVSVAGGDSFSVSIGAGGNAGGGGRADRVEVNNSTRILTLGDDAYGIFAQSVGGGGGSGGFSIAGSFSSGPTLSLSLGGKGGAGGSGDSVLLVNEADIMTWGERSYGLLAQSVGGGGGNGGFSVAGGLSGSVAANLAIGGSGATGGRGAEVILNNSGNVSTVGSNAHGMFAQSVGGGGGSGGFSIAAGFSSSAALGLSFGGSGGSGNSASNVSAISTGSQIQTAGDRAYGILAQSVGGGGGDGGFSIAGGVGSAAAVNFAMGGSGGAGASGGQVDLQSASRILTLGDDSHGIFAQSVGGGGGSGGFSVSGGISAQGAAIGASIGGDGGNGGRSDQVTVQSSGDLIRTQGEHAYGILAQSIGGTGGDGGFSVAGGVSKSASVNFSMGGGGGQGAVGGQVNLDNASRILTLGRDSHGIFAQSVGGGGGSGGFSVSGGISAQGATVGASIGGSGGGGSKSDRVTVNSTGEFIWTEGEHAYGILAQSIGGSGGDGGFSVAGGVSKAASLNFSMGGSGGTGSFGGLVLVTNASAVTTLGSNSHGIFAQSVGGGGGSGGFSVAGSVTISSNQPSVALSIGGSGGTAGNASNVVVVTSGNGIVTGGERAYGILAQSVGGGGGDGGFSVAGGVSRSTAVNFSMGGKGGGGGDGGTVSVLNDSSILATGRLSHGIFAQSVGGGGGSGGYSAAGSLTFGSEESKQLSVSIGGDGGVGGDASDVDVLNSGSIVTLGTRGYGIFAQSVGGGGGDGGESKVINRSFGSPPTNGIVASAQSNSTDNGWSLNVAIGAGGDGGSAGHGGKVKVTNAGSITNFGSGAIGIFAQSVGGGGGAGGLSATDAGAGEGNTAIGLNFSLGGKGGGGGAADSVTVNSAGSIVTLGDAAHGVMAQSVGGGGGIGGASAATTAAAGSDSSRSINLVASIGGSGGAGGNGSNVVVLNEGLIDTAGIGAYGILAQSIGGGGGHGGEAKVETKEEEEDESFSLLPASGSQTNSGGKGWSVDLTFGLGGSGGSAGDGGKVIVTNAGNIVTRSNHSIGIFAQSVGGGGGAGGMSAIEGSGGGGSSNVTLSISLGGSVGGAGGGGGSADRVLVSSQGSIATLGEAAHGIMAQSIGGGGGAGGASAATRPGPSSDGWNVALTASIGGDGGVAGDAGAVDIANIGTIDTFGAGAYGILAQSIGGGGGHGGTAKVETKQENGDDKNGLARAANSTNENAGVWSLNLDIGAGGSGGSAGRGGRVTVTNVGGIVTRGSDAHAIFAQSVGGGGGAGGLSTTDERSAGGPTNITIALGFSLGGKGGEGGSGDIVTVNSQGSIVTLGDASHGIMAQSIGGGGGSGGASISTRGAGESSGPTITLSASLGGAGGVAGDGSNVVVRNEGLIDTAGSQSYGILAQSIGGGGGQAGYGRSVSESSTAFSLGVSVGGSGGSSGSGGSVAVTNLGSVTTRSNDSHGIFAQSIGGGGGDGGNAHGADARSLQDLNIIVGGSSGSSGDGGTVSIFNAGDIMTVGDGSFGLLAQSIGGGGGVGGTADIGLLGAIGIGGGGGAAGDGAAVTVSHRGQIDTFGVAAHGLFAQSIGGGGGLAGNVDRGLKDFLNIGLGLGFGRDGGNAGRGGAVTIETEGDIITRGPGSHGIFAQSIGGGGGLSGDLGLGINFAGSVGGSGDGGAVDITHQGNIVTLGAASHGIFAQSAGSNSSGAVEISVTGRIIASGLDSVGIFAQSVAATGMNGDVSITLYGGSVEGGSGSGAAVRFGGGKENFLHNFGTVSAASAGEGYAIIGTDGNDTIQNDGVISGSVDLGAGRNTFNNYSNGRFNAGAVVNLGAGSQLINAGTLAPGGDAAIQTTTLTGHLLQTTNGTLGAKLNSPTEHDRLNVSGTVSLLGGTLAVAGFNSFVPKKGDQFTVLTADEGLTGTFGTLQDPFKGNYAVQLGLLYLPNSVTVQTLQDSFRQFARSGNQRAVARNLDSFSGLEAGTEDPRGAALIEQLNAVPGRMLPEKLDRIAPEELGSMFDVTMASATVTAGDWQRRMAQARAGRAISSENLSLFDPFGRREVADLAGGTADAQRNPDYLARAAAGPGESRWGFFANGNGEFADIETTSEAAGYDTRSGGLTLGADYRVADGWLLGFTAGCADTKADLANDGRVEVNGGKAGVYATWFDQGVYLNAGVGGGHNSYDTRRDALDGHASGSTTGGELDALLGGGFEFKRDKLSIGPTLALQYTYVGIGGFTEHGSTAPLHLEDNDSHSLFTRLGARAVYDWTPRGLTLRPEVRVEWQHEYLDIDRALDSRFANGAGTVFQVRSPSIGRDSLPVTAGLSMRLSEGISASVYYTGQFARENYASHGVNGGVSFDF